MRCLIDECANIGQIPQLEKLVATIRSREISACLVLQTRSQLKAIYKDNTTVTYALVNPKTKRFTSQTAKKTEYRKATHYDNDSYILEKAYYCFEHNLPSYKENA